MYIAYTFRVGLCLFGSENKKYTRLKIDESRHRLGDFVWDESMLQIPPNIFSGHNHPTLLHTFPQRGYGSRHS